MAVVHGADRPQVIHIPNGDPVTPMFSAQEMERRLSGLRSVMEQLGVDATLFTSIHNINYYRRLPVLLASAARTAWWSPPTRQTSISANIDGGQP